MGRDARDVRGLEQSKVHRRKPNKGKERKKKYISALL